MAEINAIIAKNKDLEIEVKNKESVINDTNNQITYLKDTNTIISAELQAVKHSMNNLRKSYIKLKDGVDEDNSLNNNLEEVRKQNLLISERFTK